MIYMNTLRKYTLAVLSTFNELTVEYKDSSNVDQTRKIPIKYSSREKSKLLDEHETSQILSGNYDVLPRANVALSTVTSTPERNTNRFNKINVNKTTGEFQYNSVAYEFVYDMTILCRGMNEASQIIEQIATKFNPTYTLLINETPNSTATTIPLNLLEIGLEQEEYEETSTNLVSLAVGLALKGQFYPPVNKMPVVNNIEVFMSEWYSDQTNEYNRAVKFDFVDNGVKAIVTKSDLLVDSQYGKIAPVISDIISIDGLDSTIIGTDYNLEVIFSDLDNKLSDGFIYVWSVSTGATISTGTSNVIFNSSAIGTFTVSCIITDVHGNNSGIFNKNITVV